MKRYLFIVITIFLSSFIFAQNVDSVVVTSIPTVSDSVAVDSVGGGIVKNVYTTDFHKDTNIIISSQPSILPSIIKQQNTQNSKPTVSNIVNEIPNDAIVPTISIKVTTTEELVAKEKQIAQAASAPIEDKKTATDTRKGESSADRSDKEIVAGRTYRIQVCALQTDSPAMKKSIQKKIGTKYPITTDSDDGLHKYMVGNFNTYYDAVQARDAIVKKGLSGAFVVVYFKGHRVSRQEKGLIKVPK